MSKWIVAYNIDYYPCIKAFDTYEEAAVEFESSFNDTIPDNVYLARVERQSDFDWRGRGMKEVDP